MKTIKIFLTLILLGITGSFKGSDLYSQEIKFTTYTIAQSKEVWKIRKEVPTFQRDGIILFIKGVRLVVYPGTNLRCLLRDLELCFKEPWFPKVKGKTGYFATIQLNECHVGQSCFDKLNSGRTLSIRHVLVKESRSSEICSCNGMILGKMKGHLSTMAKYQQWYDI